jgi:DNA-binding response OmpR family regulator
MSRVLVIEDDPAILRGLVVNLREDSYDVITATDGEAGYRLAREKAPDVIVLDLMLPRMSGYEVCRKLRAEGVDVPILMLTARGEEADRILGLDLGADDYLTKPFFIGELLARIRAHLRRTQPLKKQPDQLQFDDVTVDFLRYEARKGGRLLELTRKEFGILRFLAARCGEVVSRDDLLNEVWGYEASPTTRTVDTHVATLRAKVETDAASPCHLLTIHGVGYKWVS